jgi:HSP20 family protein
MTRERRSGLGQTKQRRGGAPPGGVVPRAALTRIRKHPGATADSQSVRLLQRAEVEGGVSMATQQEKTEQSSVTESGSNTRSGDERALERTSGTSTPVRRGAQGTGPFSLMRRFSEDMDRLFSDFFGSSMSRWGDLPGRGFSRGLTESGYWPEIEVHQTGNKLVIKADVPGLKKEDVSVEVRDNELCISGERKTESERNEGGYFRTERSYGSFCRTIPLPEGAKADTASATFKDGVLHIEMDAPAEAQGRGRRIEVREGNPH